MGGHSQLAEGQLHEVLARLTGVLSESRKCRAGLENITGLLRQNRSPNAEMLQSCIRRPTKLKCGAAGILTMTLLFSLINLSRRTQRM